VVATGPGRRGWLGATAAAGMGTGATISWAGSAGTADRAAAGTATVTAGWLAAAAQVDPDRARDQARDILGSRRYKPADVPRPFEGALEWLGDRLRPIGDFFSRITDSLPGKIALAALLAGVVALIALLVARRRAAMSAPGGAGRGRRSLDEQTDPGRLEREADAAERRGDLDIALRLRFRAGLLRLDRAGAIHFRPSITTGQVARRLRLAAFDDLAITFDAVAYGGRHASATDVRSARAAWPRVVEQAVHR
jgi:hypothetical protein